MQENQLDEMTLSQAADYSHVTRQAIYVAMKHGKIKGWKKGSRWLTSKTEVDNYRAKKWHPDFRKIGGKKVHDIEGGVWSTMHAEKVLSSMLGRAYGINRIYYLMRLGILPAKKVGSAWVLKKEDVEDLYHKEKLRQEKN